jgi:hypothetical protein
MRADSLKTGQNRPGRHLAKSLISFVPPGTRICTTLGQAVPPGTRCGTKQANPLKKHVSNLGQKTGTKATLSRCPTPLRPIGTEGGTRRGWDRALSA